MAQAFETSTHPLILPPNTSTYWGSKHSNICTYGGGRSYSNHHGAIRCILQCFHPQWLISGCNTVIRCRQHLRPSVLRGKREWVRTVDAVWLLKMAAETDQSAKCRDVNSVLSTHVKRQAPGHKSQCWGGRDRGSLMLAGKIV